jgi:MFS family permease
VVVAGVFIGINNTLITETVMTAAPVERGVASAAYSFVRFAGAALAPWLAGRLGEQVNVHLPYWVGAAAVLAAAGVLAVSRRHLVGHHTAAEQPGEQSGEQSGVVASAR